MSVETLSKYHIHYSQNLAILGSRLLAAFRITFRGMTDGTLGRHRLY